MSLMAFPEDRVSQALAVARDALYHSTPGTAGEREAKSLIAWIEENRPLLVGKYPKKAEGDTHALHD